MAGAINKKNTIEKMQELGTYKIEFEPVIERYVKLSKEYKKIYAKYEDDGCNCTIESASGKKKSPVVSTLESLRRDILNLEDALGLTPRGLLKLNDKAFEKPKVRKTDSLI